jgi:ribonuclease T2
MARLLFGGIVLAAVGCSQGENAEYVLALSWQPAFCERQPGKPECRDQTGDRADAMRLSLHGLWPQPGTRVYCGVEAAVIEADKQGRWRELPADRIEERLWRRLQEAMPGTRSSLHRHEWIKHGTCKEGDIAGYFSASLALLDAVNAAQAGRLFAASVGQYLSAEQIRAAFDASFGQGAGARVKLSCSDDDGRRLLSEITIGLAGDIGEGADMAKAILAAKPVDPGCPGGVVDEAGQQ